MNRPPDLQANITDVIGGELPRLKSTAVGMFLIGAVLCGIGAFFNAPMPEGLKYFFHSYLFAYLFWAGVTMGSVALLMLHHTVGGGWGYVIRRFLEAGTKLLPLMVGLFIPIAVGLYGFGLYSWANPTTLSHELQEIVHAKSAWLNPPFFIVRGILYLAVLWGFAQYVRGKSAILDRRNDPNAASAASRMSAFGLVIYVIIVTFMTVDWIMSLSPDWYSSIFGLLVLVSQGLSTLALMVFLISFLAGRSALLREVPSEFFRDLGNLMLAFVMLWGYMSLSQYLITYSGNMTEEISWYLQRRVGGWGWISLSLIPLHFFLPFFVLLIRSDVKKDPNRLAKLAGFILFMRLVDLWWWVTPTFVPGVLANPIGLVCDLGAPLLIGGIWLFMWAGQVEGAREPVVPPHDPRVEGNWQEVIEHG